MTKYIFTVIPVLLLFSLHLFCQDIEIGGTINLNTNFVIITSSSKLENDVGYNPGSGYGGGIFLAKPINENLKICSSLEFLLIRNNSEPEQYTFSIEGDELLLLGKERMNNYSIRLEILPGYFSTDKTFIRCGIGLDYLLASRSVYRVFFEDQLKNFRFRNMGLYLPLQIGYEFEKSSLALSFSPGLSNRLKKGYNTKEYNNTFKVIYCYRIK